MEACPPAVAVVGRNLTKRFRDLEAVRSISFGRRRDFAEAADLLAARPELTSTLITHRFPIEDAVEAFRLAQDKSKGVFRVVVEP